MSEPAIRAQNLGKLYKLYEKPSHRMAEALGLGRLPFVRIPQPRHFWALRGLDLDIKAGTRLGVIGRNGAGKSTLVRMLAGTLEPTEGAVRVAGKVQALLQLGTGFHPEFTGRQNTRVSLAYQGLSSTAIDACEEEVIDFAEIGEFVDRPVRTYSSGMYARLAFSVATAVRPEVLIIDEILSTGDAYFAGKCIERMKTLTHESGATVIFVSHDLAGVQHLCDRVIWIDRGRIIRDGEPLDVIKAYSASVRADEEARLRARDRRIPTARAACPDSLSSVYDRLLFHLVPADGSSHPSSQHRIYSVRLENDGESVAEIDVGGPLDNSPDQRSFVLDDPGRMDWGQPASDARGSYRAYGDFAGRYAHAPFELAVAKTLAGRPLPLVIAHAGEEPVAVEIYTPAGYRALGVLPAGAGTERIEIAADMDHPPTAEASHAPQAQEPRPASTSEYGEGGARITHVALYDHDGRETRVLETDMPARVVFEYEADEAAPRAVFVFCVYLADGRCATQFVAGADEGGRSLPAGRGRVTFVIPALQLGQAAYVASAAIFKRLRHDGLEAESYHVLDRCIHFQVVRPAGEKYERGLCLQPFEAVFSDG